MNIERLTILADYCEKIPPAKFSMRRFFSKPIDPNVVEIKCGTTACLAGWACTIPELKKAGLGVTIFPSPRFDDSSAMIALPMLEGYHDTWKSLEAFFDLTEEQAEWLFGEYNDRDEYNSRDNDTLEKAVGRVRHLIKTGECAWEESEEDDDDA